MTDYLVHEIELSKTRRIDMSRSNATLSAVIEAVDAAIVVPALRRLLEHAPFDETWWPKIAGALRQQPEPLLGRDVALEEAERWLAEVVDTVADDDVRVERLVDRLEDLVRTGFADPRWQERAANEARRVRGENREHVVGWLMRNV